jgi:hypothetical protein
MYEAPLLLLALCRPLYLPFPSRNSATLLFKSIKEGKI